MSFVQNVNGLGVKQTFGPAERGDTIIGGGYVSSGPEQSIVVSFDFADLTAVDFLDINLPVGAQVISATLLVKKAFVGANGILEIGSKGGEATNGLSWPVANIGTANRTVTAVGGLQGSWANPLAAVTSVGVADTSGNPFTAGSGKITLLYRV